MYEVGWGLKRVVLMCGVYVEMCIVVTVVRVVLCTVVIVVVSFIILSPILERCRLRDKGGPSRLRVGADSATKNKKARRATTEVTD